MKKRPQNAGARRCLRLCGERSELLGKFGLLVGGVVLVKNALCDGGIDGRNRLGIELFGEGLVAGFDGGKEFLDLRLHGRLDGLVLCGFLLGNQNALLGGLDVGHGIYSF